MLNSAEIRNIKFSKSVGGYKQEEVDVFLDKIEVDYDRFERAIREREAKIAQLQDELNSMETSKDSIQTVLLSAQKLADQIVADAKAKSEEIVKSAESNIELITVREKELSGEFDRKASERKARFDEEMSEAQKSAELKLKSIQNATEDSVEKQQALFDRIALETKKFKSDILKQYKEQIELLQSLPESVTDNPERVAAAVEEIYKKKSEALEFVEEAESQDTQEEPAVSENEQNVSETSSDEQFTVTDFAD